MKNILWIMCALLCMQCTNNKNEKGDGTIGYHFDSQEQLVFSEVAYPELLGSTMQIVKKDSLLFINEFHGDSLVRIFNLNNNRIQKYLVSVGNGPDELISPLELQVVGNDLWILSRPLHSLNHISFSNMEGAAALSQDGLVKPEADCFIPLGGENIVLSGFFNKRYGLMNLQDKNQIEEFGDYPDFWINEEDIPVAAKAMFHQCRFAINTKKQLFASCSYFVLDIYKYDAEGKRVPELKVRKQLGKYEYDYESGGRVTTTLRPDADPASVEVISGDEHIYVIVQDEENRKNRNIMVLDWDGKPVKLLKSGKRITCLAVDEAEGIGYCVIQDPEDKLVSFKL